MTETWEARFRAPRVSLPDCALDAPSRAILSSDENGTWEIYAWDRAAGTRTQLTSRPDGTTGAVISFDGTEVWWFDDDNGSEHGSWNRQPFEGGPATAAFPDVPDAYSAGLAIARNGTAVLGCSEDEGTQVFIVASEQTRLLYADGHDSWVIDISRDGSLVLLQVTDHGDARHPALRVVRASDGSTVATLWDGPGKSLAGYGFPDIDGDFRVLVGHERRGRDELLVWDPVSGAQGELIFDLPGDVSGQWCADGSGLLIHQDHHGRSRLHIMRKDGSLDAIGPSTGVISDVASLSTGEVWLEWSCAAQPASVVDLDGNVVISANGPVCAPSVEVADVWAFGVHAFLARPGEETRLPCVFIVHGGPECHDDDSFRRDVATYVDSGFAVVTVNYRGSTGYGSEWRDGNLADIGWTELADLAIIRKHLVDKDIIDGDRVALTGASWGGYLTLLGLGIQPELWKCGVAAVPVGDYFAAYEDEPEAYTAYDKAMFGGTPAEVPAAYERASPLTHVSNVSAAVLVIAGENDPRCPIRQVENYLAGLKKHGIAHEVYRFSSGHGSYVVEERITQMRIELDFIKRHL